MKHLNSVIPYLEQFFSDKHVFLINLLGNFGMLLI